MCPLKSRAIHLHQSIVVYSFLGFPRYGRVFFRFDRLELEWNPILYILRFDDTTPFSSPQEVFLKQKQYIIDINPIQIGFPQKNHCSKAESQHHILFFCGLNWSLLCNNRSFFKGSESAVYLRGQVDSLL